MSDNKPPKAPVDQLAKELKASLAQRRPRTWKPVMATIFVCSLALVGMWYWLFPKAQAGPLQVVALDGLFTPDETPMARAQLLVPPEDETAPSLSGRMIVFEEQNLFAKVEKEPVAIRSDAKGQASTAWPVPDAAVGEFFVKWVDLDRRLGSVWDRGRVFVWPKNSPVLIVDADETLSEDESDEEAAVTLNKAAEEGWRIVYLAQTSANAADFRKARGSIESQAKLPGGPVLGRRHYPTDETLDAARRDLLKSIKSRFQGPALAVVKTPEAAQASKESGWPTILIGDAKTPAEVVRVATWADVPVRLK